MLYLRILEKIPIFVLLKINSKQKEIRVRRDGAPGLLLSKYAV